MAVDDATLRKAAQALFAEPRARIAAVAPTGLFTDVPTVWPDHLERLPGKSLLDSVALADQPRAIEAWERAQSQGAASAVLRPRCAADGAEAAVHFIDLTASDGVWLVVLIPSQEPATPGESVRAPAEDDRDRRPRFARQRKDQLAVILEVDDATTQLLGWSAEEMVGRRSLEFVHPDDHEVAIGSWIELLGSPGLGRRVRLRHLCKDGSYVWFELTNNNLLENPEFGYVATDMLDISEEMAAHEQLRAREQLLQRLTESLPVGIVQIDGDGRVVFGNAQLVEWFGHEPEALGDLVEKFGEVDAAAAESAFLAVLAGAEQGSAEVELATEPRRTCSIVVRRLTGADGSTSGAVGCVTDVTDSLRLRRELRRQAMLDPLTGVLNRAGIGEALDIARRDPGRGIAVMFVDLDTFKAVNDSFGHEVGDQLLVTLTRRLERRCRSTDTIGRMGGDEFLVVCADIDEPHAVELRDRVQQAVSGQTFELPDGSFNWSASVGLAWADGSASAVRNLVAESDADMYSVKLQRLQDGLPRQRHDDVDDELPDPAPSLGHPQRQG